MLKLLLLSVKVTFIKCYNYFYYISKFHPFSTIAICWVLLWVTIFVIFYFILLSVGKKNVSKGYLINQIKKKLLQLFQTLFFHYRAYVSNMYSIQGWQGSSVVECLPKDWEVCGSSLCHGILLWRWALHIHLAPAANISIMLLRPIK